MEFAKPLAEGVCDVSDPVTLFGDFRRYDQRLDLKSHGLFPIAAMARTLAIRQRLPRVPTRARPRHWPSLQACRTTIFWLCARHPLFPRSRFEATDR
ncbi:putative nucleotidyltransferase substrate binding domain-containing protein [uncultured Nitratireductor sp.]|uniref:putative nucleotidyltransferase substrate binding domain-containing protein n=1 Tax=uncultured Nitratireductor sp. TaxID=520953 RepID=UPI003458BCA4